MVGSSVGYLLEKSARYKVILDKMVKSISVEMLTGRELKLMYCFMPHMDLKTSFQHFGWLGYPVVGNLLLIVSLYGNKGILSLPVFSYSVKCQ